MTANNVILALLIALTCVQPSLHQVAPYIAPVQTFNLYEDAPDNTLIKCVSCIHPDPVTLSIEAVTVTQGSPRCTTDCFFLEPISPSSGPCLQYKKNALTTPPEGLDFDIAKRYTITLECKNGDGTTQEDIDIRIEPNVAPHFTGAFATGPLTATCPTDIDAGVTAGTDVYTRVDAEDRNTDLITYRMTSYPANDVFEINETTGHIYTVNPVSRFCYRSVEFHVYITDGKNQETGPLVITCQITNYNMEVMVSNTDRHVYVDEDVAVGETVYTFLYPSNPLTPTFTISSVTPSAAAGMFDISGNELLVASPLNYEFFATRDPNITVTADNGQCTPEEFWLRLHLRDKNDPPVPTRTSYTRPVNDGSLIIFNLDVAFTVVDEDFGDFVFKYRIVGDNPHDMWAVHADNDLTSLLPYDLETHGAVTTLTFEVTDPKSATATVTATITATDVNDNAPIFTQTAFSFRVSECPTDTLVGRLNATDADTSDNENNVIEFDVVNMNGISVDIDGYVRVVLPVTLGSTPSIKVGARDKGTPTMTSPWQADVSLIIQPCTTTDPTTDQCTSASSGSLNFVEQLAFFVAAIKNGNA